MATQSADSIPAASVIAVPAGDVISDEVRETAARLGVLQYLPELIALTKEIYGGFTDITVSDDPEVGDTHIVFKVPVSCSIDEALDMDLEWGRRLRKIIPRCPRVYLTSTVFQS